MENRLERLWSRFAERNMLRRLIEERFDGVFLIDCATGEIRELGEKFSTELRAGRSTMDGVPTTGSCVIKLYGVSERKEQYDVVYDNSAN